MPISFGIGPVRRLPARCSRNRKEPQVATAAGMGPVSWLLEKSTELMEDDDVIASGSDPDSLFELTSRDCSATAL